ncbi:MAG TPA: glutathione peroxidase [Chitinophagaceae bacterium]|nr:glutathione peroxidase [Chitinophagaceae bacterium]
MKKIIFALTALMLVSFAPRPEKKFFVKTSIYQFKVEGLTGGVIDFSQFKGKKILIVNTASKCGNTPQYDDLENLYKKYKDKMVIVGFPANNFGGQEPGTNTDIAEFCKKNYGVTFPMAAKISVKGDDMAPIYKYIVQVAGEHGFQDPIKWNFTKFLFDENGNFLTVFFNRDRLIPDNPDPAGKKAYDELMKYLNE